MSISPLLLAAASAQDARVRIDTARVFPDAWIPGLPADLRRVPGWRARPDADLSTMLTWEDVLRLEDPVWRTEAVAWQSTVIDYRTWIWEHAEVDDRLAENVTRLAMADPNYFKALFATIQEPRRPTQRASTILPFVPYHFQVHLSNAWLARIDAPFDWDDPDAPILDIWVPKSRGCGITVNNLNDKAWAWLARPTYRAFIHGPKQDVIFKRGDYGAMFSKIAFTLDHLPPWLIARQAPGYTQGKPGSEWYKRNLLHNLANGAQIVGDTNTESAGRGDRFLEADPDEAGEYDNLEELLSSLRYAAKVVRLTGTQKKGEWLASWLAAKAAYPENVFEINFHQNPTMGAQYVKHERARNASPEAIAKFEREVLRDPWAGQGDYVYPEARDIETVDRPYTRRNPLDLIFDPAGTGDDAALLGVQPHKDAGIDAIHCLFTYQDRLPNPEWMAHLITGIWPERGDSCYPQQPSTDVERPLGAFLYARWINGDLVRYFCDPAGHQHATNTSYIKMLRSKVLELRLREIERIKVARERAQASGEPADVWPPLPASRAGINVHTDAMSGHRLLADRQFAYRKYVNATTIQASNPSAEWGKICLVEHKYREQTDKMTSQPTVIHGVYSHIASCWEHYAIAYIYRWNKPPKQADLPASTTVPTMRMNAPRPAPGRRGPPPPRHGPPRHFRNLSKREPERRWP